VSESTITIEELRRRVEQTDVETLQVIHAMLREARHNQRRSFVTAVITAALGIVTAVSALLPSANTAWALISAAAIAIVLGYWSYANSRRLQCGGPCESWTRLTARICVLRRPSNSGRKSSRIFSVRRLGDAAAILLLVRCSRGGLVFAGVVLAHSRHMPNLVDVFQVVLPLRQFLLVCPCVLRRWTLLLSSVISLTLV